MTRETKTLIIAGLILAVLGLGGALVLRKEAAVPVGKEEVATTTLINLSEDLSNLSFGVDGDATIVVEPVPTEESGIIETPDLDRFVFGSNVVSQESLLADMRRVVEVIQDNVLNREAWLELATLRELAGDYTGAEGILLYVTSVWDDRVAFLNLGTLYADHMMRDEDAIIAYTKAVSLDPKNIQSYLTFHSFYALRPEYKKEAESILLEGLGVNPDDTFLEFTLARFYQEEGRINDARSYYEKVLEQAENTGDTALASQVTAILATL